MPTIRGAADQYFNGAAGTAGHAMDKADGMAVFGLVEDLMTGAAAGLVLTESWATIAAIVGTRNGQPGEVVTSATSTHTDPVTSSTVADAGSYRWSSSPVGWRWVAPLDAATTAASAAAASSSATSAHTSEINAAASAAATIAEAELAEASADAAALSETNAAASASAAAGSAASAAVAAGNAVAAAAAATGPAAIYATKALAISDLASIPANKFVFVVSDESINGCQVYYQKLSGSLANPVISGISAAYLLALPTTLPGASGQLWNNGGMICIS